MNKGIIHIFASATWGGGEQYVYDLAERQLTYGCRVILISAPSKSIRQKVNDLSCPYYTLKNRGHFNLFSILRVRRIILREGISIVHVHQFKDAFIAVFASILMVARNRPRIILTRHLVKKGKKSWLYRWLYGKLDKMIFVSELAKKVFLTNLKLDEKKIVVIHNSIPEKSTIIKDIDYRKLFNLNEDYTLIGFTGRLVQYKGVELIIDVADRLRDKNLAFLLAGQGEKEYELYLQKLIIEKKLTDKVFLLGFLDNIENFITKMDIALLPSLWREPFGLSVLEFMRAGIPVITSNTGAQVEFVENERTGLLVNPAMEDVTQALVSLLNNESKRREIGDNAKHSYKEKFNYDCFYIRIMNEYGR